LFASIAGDTGEFITELALLQDWRLKFPAFAGFQIDSTSRGIAHQFSLVRKDADLHLYVFVGSICIVSDSAGNILEKIDIQRLVIK
jgi:hypothetical protein